MTGNNVTVRLQDIEVVQKNRDGQQKPVYGYIIVIVYAMPTVPIKLIMKRSAVIVTMQLLLTRWHRYTFKEIYVHNYNQLTINISLINLQNNIDIYFC